MTIYELDDVFTPTSPATLTFVERESIRDQITNALRTKGKQIIVYGPSKSGKSTLVNNKVAQIYENFIKTRCMHGMTINSLMLDAFDQLDPYYIINKKNTKKSGKSSELGLDYKGLKANIKLLSEKTEEITAGRIIPPQLNARKLAEFIGKIKACWIIEDFHKIDKKEKENFSDIMKVFMDSSENYKFVKIIAIGVENTAREIVEYDSNMESRVSEIHVPLLSNPELNEIINKGEELLNIKIHGHVKDLIIQYSKGLGSVCHQICLNMCFAGDINITCEVLEKIESNLFRDALTTLVEESSDSMKKRFDRAFKQTRSQKYNNSELIINSLAFADSEGLQYSDIKRKILRIEPNYPGGNLTRYLKQLTEEKYGELLASDINSGKYYFREPIFHTYAHAIFKDSTKVSKKKKKKYFNVDTMDLEQVEQFITDHLERDFNIIDNIKIRKSVHVTWDEQ